MTGIVVGGKYELGEVISKKDESEVHRGKEIETGNPVVVKMLRPSSSADSNEQLQRRMQEFKVLKRLNHPNVVQVLETGLTDDNAYYVVMDYLDGAKLSELQSEGPMDPLRVANYLDQLASVLDKAHDSQIVHRDLRPGNMIITKAEDGSEHLTLIGFVLAKVLADSSSQVTQAGMAVGTPTYMSPEQAMGRATSRLSDVYSVGVTLFALLTGRLPFDKGKDVQTLLSHVKDPIPEFRSVNRSLKIGPSIEAVVRQALAKTPADRPKSVGELARLFREAIENPNAVQAFEQKETPRVMYDHVEVPKKELGWAMNFVFAALLGLLIGFIVLLMNSK